MQFELESLVIASLLHDIGKFAQRANKEKSNLENILSPVKHGKYTHSHVQYTDRFIETKNYVPLPKELQAEREGENYRSLIARIASSHHNPSDILPDLCLQIADRLSSGLDRIENNPDGNYKTARLHSIFSAINLNQDDKSDIFYHKLAPLAKEAFPVSKQEAQNTNYESLFEGFVNDMQNIPVDFGIRNYISSLTSILEKFTWAIPSCTYKTEPDISLYDHSVTTAAIAQAIYLYAKQNNLGHDSVKSANFILLAGEFSGIQKYIFTGEGGKGHTKILRARSFHLQMLTRSIILDILDKLTLLPIAKIMDAGGRFMLLLPNTKESVDVLNTTSLKLQQYFFDNFAGELQIHLANIVLKQEDMKLDKFKVKLDDINDKLELQKISANQDFFQVNSPVYNLDWSKYQEGQCPYCQRMPADVKDKDEEYTLCKFCDSLIQIGKDLAKSQYAVFFKKSTKRKVKLNLFGDIGLNLYAKENFEKDSSLLIDALDIINMSSRERYTSQAISGFIPKKNDEKTLEISTKTFEDLAFESTDKITNQGVKMLGVLKADVDNLGLIFSIGFKFKDKLNEQKNLSISRFSNLSRMLNFFFAEYLNEIIQTKYQNIYTVFTGGDDLFVLGTWTEIIEFTQQMQVDFNKFVACNKNVTISAGIAMAKPKTPISTIAKMAEHELEKSKNISNKNACTLFGISAKWNYFNQQIDLAKWFVDNIQKEQITQGLVRRLLKYSSDSEELKKGEIKKGIYRSHLAYDLARNISEDENGKAIKDKINEITVTNDNFHQARMAISYALYKTRKV